MESRKKRNLEIEKMKRRQRRIFTGILAVLIVLVFCALGYGIWDMINRRTIMTFNGTRVATSDFRFLNLRFGGTADDIMENLTALLVTMERAEYHGLLPVPAAQRAEFTREAAAMREEWNREVPGILNFISDARIAEIFAAEEVIIELFEIYTGEYEPDETEFNEFIEEHMDWFIEHAATINVKYLVSTEATELQQVAAAFAAGGDFDAAVREHYSNYDEEFGVEIVPLFGFLSWYNLEERREELSAVAPGEVTGIFEEHGMFFLMYMYEFDDGEEALAEMIESERESFIHHQRMEAFAAIMEEWLESAEVTVNDRAFRRFLQ